MPDAKTKSLNITYTPSRRDYRVARWTGILIMLSARAVPYHHDYIYSPVS